MDADKVYEVLEKGTVEQVSQMLDDGMAIDAYIDDETPLIIAIKGENLEVATLLIERGAEVNACHRQTRAMPLHYAAMGGHVELAINLMRRGADRFALDCNKRTPRQVMGRKSGIDWDYLSPEARRLLAWETHELGEIGLRPAAHQMILEKRIEKDEIVEFLCRHRSGDFGDLNPVMDQQRAAGTLGRSNLVSQFTASNGEVICIVTEIDRSRTTVLAAADVLDLAEFLQIAAEREEVENLESETLKSDKPSV